jgi:hypothetical protein
MSGAALPHGAMPGVGTLYTFPPLKLQRNFATTLLTGCRHPPFLTVLPHLLQRRLSRDYQNNEFS